MNTSVTTTPGSQSAITPMTATPHHSCANYSLANELQIIYHDYTEQEEIYPVFDMLKLWKPHKITDTLQGSVWRAFQKGAKNKANPPSVIAKVTKQTLHKEKKAILNNKEYKVSEDIVAEQAMLKYLTQQKDCPDSIIKYKECFKTKHHYWLLMEDGGSSLITLVQKAHRSIRAGNLEISEWRKALKIIMNQMIESVEYLHNQNICHYDISLENFLINDLSIEVDEYHDKSWKFRFILDAVHVKLCDFGLAEQFAPNVTHCRSKKWCGKRQYKSPEAVYKLKDFDAKKNDIWCLGACFMALCFGFIPWQMAHEKDEVFSFLMEHSITDLLKCWNIEHYIDETLVYIFDSIFQDEEDRINIAAIKKCLFPKKTKH